MADESVSVLQIHRLPLSLRSLECGIIATSTPTSTQPRPTATTVVIEKLTK